MNAHADVARGEHASFQFVIRANSDINDLNVDANNPFGSTGKSEDVKTGFVSFVKVGRINPEPSNDSYKPVSGYFPDPIMYEDKRDVAFGTTQPLWLSVKIPADTEPGIYEGKLEISFTIGGKKVRDEKKFTIEVFKPLIDKTSLKVTNWFFLDRLHYLNNMEAVEKHSDLYWELAGVMAETLAQYRQNVAMISPFST